MDTTILNAGIFIETSGKPEVKIMCNYCTLDEVVFYEDDGVSYYPVGARSEDWIKDAALHLAEFHGK